ncbi:ABC transporter permease, partial [Bacillus wiedmannii]
MSISIFYMFETLALNEAFLTSNSPIQAMGFIFHAGTVLLTILTFFYILYANSFLLSLRQKEFGMYMMLGAKKHKVITLMFMETIVLGSTALIIGITIGIGLSKGVGQLLMKQLDVTVSGYQALYVPSVTVTGLFFLALFVLSAIMNSIKLSRISVLQLVHASSKTERTSIGRAKTVVIAFLAITFLVIGYASMIYMDKLKQNGIIIALITVTSGTYMLFGTFLPLVIQKLKSNKKRREKGLNAFTFAQL